jgi:hypothetical protein
MLLGTCSRHDQTLPRTAAVRYRTASGRLSALPEPRHIQPRYRIGAHATPQGIGVDRRSAWEAIARGRPGWPRVDWRRSSGSFHEPEEGPCPSVGSIVRVEMAREGVPLIVMLKASARTRPVGSVVTLPYTELREFRDRLRSLLNVAGI